MVGRPNIPDKTGRGASGHGWTRLRNASGYAWVIDGVVMCRYCLLPNDEWTPDRPCLVDDKVKGLIDAVTQ